jgi:branched-chain amino acid aminotransferase
MTDAPYDWSTLDFSLHPVKSMYIARCKQEDTWEHGALEPFGDIPMSPAAGVLNYAQGAFEGMKAQRNKDNEIVLFRPHDNAKRFANSAERLCMPPVPEDVFMDAVTQVARDNADFIPPHGRGTLYMRPLLIGSGALLGNGPAPEYTFIVFASPVANYFTGDLQPICVKICTDFYRAPTHGMGNAKYIGNYAACYESTLKAKAEGYRVCLYLDAKEGRYLEEAGSANLFFYKDGKLLTPELGSILPGITRDSIIKIAREHMGLEVIETKISIDEALAADECFCTGTAAIITPIGVINAKGQDHTINHNKVGDITQTIYDLYRGIQAGSEKDTLNWITKLNP